MVVGILMFVFKLLAPNVLRYFSVLEVFFVNSVGLPFNSGTIIAGILLVTFFYYLLNYTIKNNLKTLNTVSLCVLFILIGFSSWIMLPIRANSDVVINENDPADARQLLAYYNLEQYPKTHLFYGPLFTDQYSGLDEENPYKDDKPKYEKDLTQNKYVIVNNYKNASQNFNSEHASILPRMWSSEHASNYLRYTGFLDYEVKKKYRNQAEAKELIDLVNDFKTRTYQGDVDYEEHHKFLKNYGTYLDIEKPSLISNVKYLIQYQLGYMYWRYFMWNFSGRQDDIQGRMDMHGNWISGLDFIDEIHLGLSQENLPSDVAENKSRNKYYMIPFIIGLIGLYFLYNKDKELFWTMLVFFIFTGIAIQVYTNVRPFEPRERDYSVVGSFYVYCIWIGFGIFSIIRSTEHFINSKYAKLLTIPVFLLILPINLASSNWDDHDRSGRYTARSMAIKYLESCEPNSILFTIGDNDTFPLWYLQEIEGVRTDVRVLNTSLFNTDWYIDQMKRKAYESDPIPSSISHDKYRYGTRDYIIKEVTTLDTIDIKTFIKFVTQDDDKYKYKSLLQKQGYETNYMREQDLNANYLPSESIRIPVDKESVLKNNIVDNNLSDEIVDEIIIKIKGQALYKNRLMMLDIIAENNWERPIYFTGGSFGDDDYLWMKDYLQLEGLCYKLVPIKTKIDQTNPYEMGRVNTEKMYSMVKDWDWGTNGDMDIYFDVESRKNSITYRSNIARLINQLILENKKVKAEEITDIVIENMPVNIFGYYTLLESYIESYYKLENKEKARGLFSEIANKYKENLFYFSSLKDENKNRYAEEIYTDIERYRSLVGVIISYEEGKFLEKQMEDFNYYLELFIGKEE